LFKNSTDKTRSHQKITPQTRPTKDIPHINLVHGVIIIKEKNLEKVLNFLNAHNAEIYTKDVTLTPEDEKTLTKKA